MPEIKNKIKRELEYNKNKNALKQLKRKVKQRRKQMELDNAELKEERLKNNVPRTIESMRRPDETIQATEEVEDEYAEFFAADGYTPKVLITTSPRPSKRTFQFADELLNVIPSAEFVKRPSHKSHTSSGAFYEIQDLVRCAKERSYTSLVIVEEDRNRKKLIGLIIVNLMGAESTCYFKLSSVSLSKEIYHHARATAHKPELVLNGFTTRLGRCVGRLFATLFPKVAQFQGRQVATLHNQRDYIFFRRHRYIFEDASEVRLQEIGPRFTLKLQWMQRGIYDLNRGDFEFYRKPDMDVDRKKFYL